MVTGHLTKKLVTAKCRERVTLQNYDVQFTVTYEFKMMTAFTSDQIVYLKAA